MSGNRPGRGLVWALVGAAVLIVALAAVILPALLGRPEARPTASQGATQNTPDGPTSAAAAVVDPSVTRYGWVPEPVTRDRDVYMRAALAAASTFDPSKSTRDNFLAHLATWFTPDTRRTNAADRERATQLYLGDLSRSVVLPQDQWDQMRSEQAAVTAKVDGPITHVAVSDDPGGMSIGTANVILTYRHGDVTNTEHVRVSVQVLCGPGSVPAPDSPQQAGDCKVVRFFDSAVEE